jgi:hypothetical protein
MKKKHNNRPLLVVLVIALIGVGWMVWRDWNGTRIEAARKQEAEMLRQRADDLARKLTQLEQEFKTVWELPPEEKAAEVFGPDQAVAREVPPGSEEVERRVKAFFSYLDSRNYIHAYKLGGGVYREYLAAVEALSLRPPKGGQTASLQEMKRNIAYFYWVLGKQRLQLFADILQHEPEIIEPTLRVFYQWYTDTGSSVDTKGRPSLGTMYAYASYLVETFGGRSYLLRRDSRTRLLMIYYCILVLDRADDQKLNPYGIDIRPLIAATANDMRSQKGLSYQKQYIADLDRLARKYQM